MSEREALVPADDWGHFLESSFDHSGLSVENIGNGSPGSTSSEVEVKNPTSTSVLIEDQPHNSKSIASPADASRQPEPGARIWTTIAFILACLIGGTCSITVFLVSASNPFKLRHAPRHTSVCSELSTG